MYIFVKTSKQDDQHASISCQVNWINVKLLLFRDYM